ncbi:MarR family winged helix-turn-helix transcriptional regulator [Ohtaekwangia sp.]|uniref:MarR family winged helix-turn-helix transcriptional regulator n=1 Tax=Ohtaekwangia sp. TaxID=2066019 RepID=UPI002F92793B
MKIDDRLREFEKLSENNWQRLIFRLRKHLDIWAQKKIKPSWGQMKLSYMPVIFNISMEGSTAIEISRKSKIAKQAMSRTVNELEEKGMITSKIDKNDKRSERLELTAKGKQLVLDAHLELLKLQEDYKSLVGERNLKIAVDVINKIIEHHEKLNASDDEQYVEE